MKLPVPAVLAHGLLGDAAERDTRIDEADSG